MPVDTDVRAVARQYARETRRRMGRAIRDLLSIQRVGSGDTSRVSAWIRQQGEASRAAGFARLARLCETMNDCLAGLRNGERPVVAPMVGTLLEVCRTVQLHADALVGALRRAGTGAAGRQDREAGTLTHSGPREGKGP
jgi:hypothetical protein